MVQSNRNHNSRYNRSQRGQTLIIALIVLFALLFLGGVFVTRIARNLQQSGRTQQSGEAAALAQAGLDYCNQELNTSPQGADWRPTPSTPINNQDPDIYWLVRGFSRIPVNGGRALVRVAYDPCPDNPNGSNLVIEAVGRPGALPNPPGSDPTVFVPTGNSPRLRQELVAYKQIGLTDYGLYVTGATMRTVSNYIGTPAIGHNVATVLGNPMLGFSAYASGVSNVGPNGAQALYGFPIYVNGNLKFGSDTYLYEGHRGGSTSLTQEGVLVNGTIGLDPSRTTNLYTTINDSQLPAYLNEEIDQSPSLQVSNIAGAIQPSTGQFNSYNGLVRDANGGPDVNGIERAVPRLTPPSLDTLDGSGVLRYRALTRDSGSWYTNASNALLNTGADGYGTGIYVNNFADQQRETSVAGLNGAYSLRSDWLNPQAHLATTINGVNYGWDGPYYRAPGVDIVLLGNTIQMTRDDGVPFTLPDGTQSETITIPLWDYARANTVLPNGIHLMPLRHDGDNGGANSPFGDKNSYGVSLVLFAEGNVRVHGVYGAITNSSDTSESATVSKLGRVHLTIVSGGTAYIEGNLVSGDGYVSGGSVTMEHASTLAILAKDYVTVNTTMFMRPQTPNTWTSENEDSNPPFYTELGQGGSSTMDMAFSWGVDPSQNYSVQGNRSPLFLMVRQGGVGSGVAPYNLLLNPGVASPATNAYYQFPFNTVPSAAPAAGTYGVIGTEMLGLTLFPGNTQLPGLVTPGYDNVFRFQFDRSAALAGQELTDMKLGGAAVVPLDIRVEATLYAQNRSFFVIPGYSFNPNKADSRAAYQLRGDIRISYNGADVKDISNATPLPEREAKDVFPFYGEPTDIRITMFGSIAENYTASAGDQAAWMARWGYIPAYYGSTEYYTNTAASVRVPDMHLLNQDPISLVAGEDTTLNYRTPLETQAAGTPAPDQDIPITNGLRYEYNPILAMPYYDPTDVTLIPLPNHLTRQQRAIRSRSFQITVPGGGAYTIEQVLPAIPDLPVCPNALYSGQGTVPVGSLPDDSDQL